MNNLTSNSIIQAKSLSSMTIVPNRQFWQTPTMLTRCIQSNITETQHSNLIITMQIADNLSASHRDQLAIPGIHRHILPLPSPEIVTVLLNRELDRVRAAFLNPQDDEVRRGRLSSARFMSVAARSMSLAACPQPASRAGRPSRSMRHREGRIGRRAASAEPSSRQPDRACAQ